MTETVNLDWIDYEGIRNLKIRKRPDYVEVSSDRDIEEGCSYSLTIPFGFYEHKFFEGTNKWFMELSHVTVSPGRYTFWAVFKKIKD